MTDAARALFPRGEFALQLARDGFRVFPLIVGGRTPAIKKWPQRATRNLAQIEKWWRHRDFNIGIATGRADDAAGGELWLTILDYDGKQGKQGVNILHQHTAKGWTVSALVVKTPHGFHVYFYSKVKVSNSVSRVATHVDVRGYHGYVVGPGSVVGGFTYARLGTSGIEPAELPGELLALAGRPSEMEVKLEKVVPLSGVLDTASARERAKAYLINSAPEAIEGEGGDITTYKVACRVKDFGISEHVCFELLRDYYNEEKCNPPWEQVDLARKVLNAYKYGINPPGIEDPLDQFGDVFDQFPAMEADEVGGDASNFPEADTDPVDAGPPPGQGGASSSSPGMAQAGAQTSSTGAPALAFHWINIPRVWIGQAPERQWTVLNHIPRRQAGAFMGQGSAGKSTIELYRCACHVMGRDWFGLPVTQGPAMYVGCEDESDEIWRRVEAVCRYMRVTLEELVSKGFMVSSKFGEDATLVTIKPTTGRITTTPLYMDLLNDIKMIQPVNVSLDPLSRIYGGSEIDRVQVYDLVARLQHLAMAGNSSVTMLGHPSLEGISSGTGSSGSTAWHGAFRYRMYLYGKKKKSGEDKDDNKRTLEFMKNQYGPIGSSIQLRYRAGMFLPVGLEEKKVAEAVANAAFLNLLARYGREGRVVSDKSRGSNYAPKVFAEEQEALDMGLGIEGLEAAMRRLFGLQKIKSEEQGSKTRRYSVLIMV